MKKERSISIVIPAFNEQENIREAVESAVTEARKLTADYEVIVLNDGSNDDTQEVLDSLKNGVSKLSVLIHQKNLGIEPTLKDLYKAAKKEITFFNGADNEIKMSVLTSLIKKMDEGFDIVVAKRETKNYNLFRGVLSWGFNFLIKIMFGVDPYDAGCAKLFKTEIYKNLKINSESPFGEAERLIKAHRMGFKISSVPVTHYRGEKVSSIKLKHALDSLGDLLRVLVSR